MRKRLILGFLLSACVCQGRAEISENSEELTKVQSGLEAANQNMQRLLQQKNALNAQLSEVEKLYGNAAALLRMLKNQVEQKRQNLTKIRQEMRGLEDEMTKQNKEIAGQMKSAYMMGQKEKLKLLLNQQDPALSSRMLVYYDYLNKARLAKLAGISESMQNLERLDRQQQQETELLEKNLKQKQVGQMSWPVKGRLSNKFGSARTESEQRVWDGVLIEASEGTEVRAISRGKVVYSDWLRGYGMLTIVDHGEGYMSLYAFNQSLYRKVGEWVDVGDVIASVGQSGGRSQSGLYFGIRSEGKSVDPLEWCRK